MGAKWEPQSGLAPITKASASLKLITGIWWVYIIWLNKNLRLEDVLTDWSVYHELYNKLFIVIEVIKNVIHGKTPNCREAAIWELAVNTARLWNGGEMELHIRKHPQENWLM